MRKLLPLLLLAAGSSAGSIVAPPPGTTIGAAGGTVTSSAGGAGLTLTSQPSGRPIGFGPLFLRPFVPNGSDGDSVPGSSEQ